MTRKREIYKLNFDDEEKIEQSYSVLYDEIWDLVMVANSWKVTVLMVASMGMMLMFPLLIIFTRLTLLLIGDLIPEFTYGDLLLVDFIISLGLIFRGIWAVYKDQLKGTLVQPSLLSYLDEEIKKFNLEIKRESKSLGLLYYLLGISIIAMKLIGGILIIPFNVIYEIVSFIPFIPMYYIVRNKKALKNYHISIKNKYFISLGFLMEHDQMKRKKLRTKRGPITDFIISLTSNPLCRRNNQGVIDLHNEISEKRWMPKKVMYNEVEGYEINVENNKYLFFYEYATPINFFEKIQNMISALREWDESGIKKY